MTRFHILLTLPALIAITREAAAQGTFTGLGAPETYLSGISADGTIAVGVRSNFGPAFRWTAAGGVVNIGGVGALARISRDGKTIVSDSKDAQGNTSAAIWQGGTNWRVLPPIPNSKPLDGNVSTAYSVSGDGSVIAGLAWVSSAAHGFRWDATNGSVDLGSLQHESSRVNAVSADGHVIVGWDENPDQSGNYNSWRGAIWWQGMERLINPFGWIGQAEGTNDSGSVIVGRGHPMSYRHAYRFTAWDGHTDELGALVRGVTPNQKDQEDQSIAYATSDDGSVVVGASGWMPPLDAFVWTPDTQMIKLSDYLASKGVAGFDRWQLVTASAVSPNGKIIAGVGINPRGAVEGWIATLP